MRWNGISYKYNDGGIRTQKTVNGVATKYHLVGDKVTFEENGTDKIYYTYDSLGDLVSMSLNGVEYYYIRNAQGDIIGLFDKAGTQVVSYVYDSWGKVISISGSLKDTVGVKNPYRYRGYRYDSETGLYYLQSRYYNPEWGRFINGDAIGGQVGKLLSHNIFAYCFNNPISMSDDDGNWPSWNDIKSGVSKAAQWVAEKVESFLSNQSPAYNWIEAAIGRTIITDQSLSKQDRYNKVEKGLDITTNAMIMCSVGGKPKATKHAVYRKAVTGRITGPVLNDIQRVRPIDVLIEDNGNYIIRGSNGRVHVLSPDGQRHITSLNRTSSNINSLIMQGRYKQASAKEYADLIMLYK